MALAQARHIDAVLVTELSRWGHSTTDLANAEGIGDAACLRDRDERHDLRSLVAARSDDRDRAGWHCRVRARADPGAHPFRYRSRQGPRQAARPAAGQRPKSDRLGPKVLALIALGRSYRLIGREVGLSKNTVADIVKRNRITADDA